MILLRNVLRETVYMRFMIAFILGIIAYEMLHKHLNIGTMYIVLSISIIVFLYYLSILNKYNITFKFSTGLTVFILCALFSFQLSYYQDLRNSRAYFESLKQHHYEIEIKNIGRKTIKNCIYEVEAKTKNISFPILLSIEDDSLRYKYGDKLFINGRPKALDFINNPGQFDYKKYLSRKHIYHKFQIKKNDITQVIHNNEIGIWEFSTLCRQKLLNILKKNIKDEESYEMSAALLLGERADLDKNLLKSYSNTGTIHIISVSGLHVGIIFLVIQYLLKYIKVIKSEYLRGCIIIITIWFYATLTGLPASVIRSASMISFHTIGKMRSANVNSINHVAASAIFLLSIQTNYLFDIGFQLSYLAVFGIMYLQKWINDLYFPENIFTQFIWTTTSVSIAAQLFTLPLCIYYFKQFPNYFIIANLLAIPLSSIALYASIGLLFFAYIPYLNIITVWVLTYSIKILNLYLSWLSEWPNALSLLPSINIIQLILFSLIIFFLLIYLKEKMRIGLKLLIIALILYTTYSTFLLESHLHEHLWIINNQHSLLFSIEKPTEIIHLIPKKTKIKTVNSMLKDWRNYTRKQQHIVFIENSKYKLLINNKLYKNKDVPIFNLKEKYERICLK